MRTLRHNNVIVIVLISLTIIFIPTSCVTVNQQPEKETTTQYSTRTTTNRTHTSTATTSNGLTQEIRYTMPPGAVKKSTASYSKNLQTGTDVQMSVSLTGEYQEKDWSYSWGIQVLGPGGESMHQWTGHWVDNNHHSLSFTASYGGAYTVKITHFSLYPKNMTIKVKPAGWGYAGE